MMHNNVLHVLQIGSNFVNPEAIDNVAWPTKENDGKGYILLRSGEKIYIPEDKWDAVSAYFSKGSETIY